MWKYIFAWYIVLQGSGHLSIFETPNKRFDLSDIESLFFHSCSKQKKFSAFCCSSVFRAISIKPLFSSHWMRQILVFFCRLLRPFVVILVHFSNFSSMLAKQNEDNEQWKQSSTPFLWHFFAGFPVQQPEWIRKKKITWMIPIENGNNTSGKCQLVTGQFNEWIMMLSEMVFTVESQKSANRQLNSLQE